MLRATKLEHARRKVELENLERVEILRYHHLAETKYASAGMDYRLKGLESPTEAEAESRQRILVEQGVSVVVVR